jgi:hypothetical protein
VRTWEDILCPFCYAEMKRAAVDGFMFDLCDREVTIVIIGVAKPRRLRARLGLLLLAGGLACPAAVVAFHRHATPVVPMSHYRTVGQYWLATPNGWELGPWPVGNHISTCFFTGSKDEFCVEGTNI